ncbi:MAG: helix-turn-helix domain-containing protein [Nocardioidaceae bacterium]
MTGTVASNSPALLRRWIALNLKQLRKAAGRSQPDAAKRLGVSRATVTHLESARNLPAQPTLEILLGYYGVPERLDDFVRVVEAAKKGRNWWAHLSESVPPWLNLFLGLESGAAELRLFDNYLVPGILQTPAYAEATVRADPDLTEDQVRERVELRTGRQHILTRTDEPVRLWAVLDESVLRRPRGAPAVMTEQIDHLLQLSERPRIDVQVLPMDAGAHVAQQGSFQVLKFPNEFVGDPGIVYLELLAEGRYHEEPDEIDAYELALTRLQVLAASPEDSRAIMQQARKEVKQ